MFLTQRGKPATGGSAILCALRGITVFAALVSFDLVIFEEDFFAVDHLVIAYDGRRLWDSVGLWGALGLDDHDSANGCSREDAFCVGALGADAAVRGREAREQALVHAECAAVESEEECHGHIVDRGDPVPVFVGDSVSAGAGFVASGSRGDGAAEHKLIV